MLKLSLLSSNILTILNALMENQNLIKYLYYNQSNPLSQPDITSKDVMFKNIYPYPFTPDPEMSSKVELRVFYPNGELNDDVVEDTIVFFDIVIANDLWLVNDGSSKLRPYEILSEITNTFHKKSIGTLGRLNFGNFRHIIVNDKFNIIRLNARVVTFGVG